MPPRDGAGDAGDWSRARCTGRRCRARRRSPALYATALRDRGELGLALPEHAVGGGSEANLAAGAGAAVLDGLGPVGAGSHALDEYVLFDSMVERAALLAGLVAALQA